MTTINALKLDFCSGLMICDEERTWHLRQKLNSIEKIKSLIPPVIQTEQGTVARLGTTGTCSIGAEILRGCSIKLHNMYSEKTEKLGKKPDFFLTVEEISNIIFEYMIEVKHRHVDDLLLAKYGFVTKDFIRGYYMSGEKKIEIKDKEIIKGAEEMISWSKKSSELNKILGNGAIVAGYDSKEGFNIFHLSLSKGRIEPVPFIFRMDGSGRDVSEIRYNDYVDRKPLRKRRDSLDPVEAMVMMLEAFVHCRRIAIGVGGWPDIIYINGREKDNDKKVKDIDDERAKLATEIIDASCTGEFFPRKTCYELIEELVFNDGDFETVHLKMWRSVANPALLSRFLRGHK